MSKSSLIRRLIFTRQSKSRYLELLGRVGECLRSSPDLKTAIEDAAKETATTLGALRCVVILGSDGNTRLSAGYTRPSLSSGIREKLELVDAELTRSVGGDATTTELNEPPSDSRVGVLLQHAFGNSQHPPAVRSILLVPLVQEAQAIGAVVIYGARRRWSSEEKQTVQAIASSLSLMVYQTESNERAKSAADREALTSRLLTAIRTAVGVDELLKVAIDGVGAVLGVTRAVIYMQSGRKPSTEQESPTLKARAEYRESVLVPSLLGSELDIQGSPLLGQLVAGEMVTIPETHDAHPVVKAIGVRLGVRALALAPIAYGGTTVAVLSLEQFDWPREFSEDELGLIRLVTEQTSVALNQAELYREAEEAARREALVSRITSAIHRSLDSEAVLQSIVNELGEALAVCRCRFALLPNPMPESIPITHEYVAECCSERAPMLRTIPVLGNFHLQTLLSTNRPIATDDIMSDPGFASNREQLVAGRVKSVLANAIRLGGKPIGVFSLHHCEDRHCWTEWEIDVVQSVTEQAAVAIRQAELYREARESATRAALANQMVSAIRKSLDVEKTLQVAVQELGRATGASRTSFLKVTGDQMIPVAEYLTNPEFSVSQISERTDGYVFDYLRGMRRTLIIDDVTAFASAYPDLSATVNSWQIQNSNLSQITSPIFVNDQLWGALSIGHFDKPHKWTASEIALVEVVTAQVEIAVSHSHLFEEAKRAAQRDALVSRIIHGINQSNQIDEIFPVVARSLGEHLECDRLLMITFNDADGLLTVDCEYGGGMISKPGTALRTQHFATFESLIQDNVLSSDDVENDPRFENYLDTFLRPLDTRAFMAVHLRYERGPRLAIAAIMNSLPRKWSDEDVEVTRAAASQVCIALQRAELFEQVSQSKHDWESTFHALSDGIFIFDEHGVLRRVNEAAAAFEGRTPGELINRRCCTLLNGIEGEECRVAQVIRTGRPVTFELVPKRLSRPVLVTMSPLLSRQGESGANGEGRPRDRSGVRELASGAVCVVRDLSELRAAEAVAREQRSFLIKLIEHANDAIFALSPEGRFVWFNEQLVGLSGYSREEIISSDFRRFIPPDEHKLAVDKFTGALRGQAQTTEIHGIRKGGEVRLLLITYSPIYDEGKVTSVLSIARDVTEERMASERAAQADKLRALGQLASGVAHNFNNVLAAVLGHAQLIKRDCRDDNTLERIDIIERAALDGAQTVKRIQGFGLQQNDSLNDSIDVNQLVQDSTNLTRARWRDDARARGLHYDVEADLKKVQPVLGSASDLREVFVNIILNALDAMPQGGRLSIATKMAGSVVQISFADNGIGMSREVCDRVFEPFFTTKGAIGMGLGLAVSYSIVERHGGRIEARSNPGRGSSFVISLPAGDSRLQPVDQRQFDHVESTRILVIDDDDRVRKALAGMLSSAGHKVDQAPGGPEALAMMDRESFDLVFTDLSMPELDGWAVAGEIRRRWPSVRVVLITGYALPQETLRNHNELVDGVLFKPIRLDEINTTISHVLRKPAPNDSVEPVLISS